MSERNYPSLDGWNGRGWIDIVDRILQTCKGGALKTHVMYRCNLNSRQVKHYLVFLESMELLERPSGTGLRGTVYRTTQKGSRYVEAYGRLEEVFGEKA